MSKRKMSGKGKPAEIETAPYVSGVRYIVFVWSGSRWIYGWQYKTDKRFMNRMDTLAAEAKGGCGRKVIVAYLHGVQDWYNVWFNNGATTWEMVERSE